MKIKATLIMAVILLAAVFSFHACKEADVKIYTVTVLISEGVTGIPQPGSYLLQRGEELQYSYSLNPGYSKLTFLFDGAELSPSGTLTISKDHTMQAYADDNFQCSLKVDMSAGVTGTPEAGTRNYPQGTVIEYNYGLEEGYYDLSVTLDNELVDPSGTITLSENHNLVVSAFAGKNIKGTWLLKETYDDGSTFAVNATFSGSFTAGTVTDSDGGSGTYTFVGAQVAFKLVFPDVSYEYEGNFLDDDTMGGNCTRYQTAENEVGGSWTATRIPSGTTAGAVSRSGKGETGAGEIK